VFQTSVTKPGKDRQKCHMENENRKYNKQKRNLLVSVKIQTTFLYIEKVNGIINPE
jgi:hypothetical protein